MKTLSNRSGIAFAIAAAALTTSAASYADLVSPLQPTPASLSPIATQAPMLAATWAGQRAVSVGCNGIILLSDNRGKSFRQAQWVPISSTLTGVSFADAKSGWAVGHWGAILATTDGGQKWQTQRLVVTEDRPLFAVHFFNDKRGVAVGLWSLVLTTQDSGETWVEQKLNPKDKALSDLNLLNLFPGTKSDIYATSERGRLLHSRDAGSTWEYLNTGYEGSLWCGTQLSDGTLLVGGQRGTLLRSEDAGKSWVRVQLDRTGSITSIDTNGIEVIAIGLDGLRMQSLDGGRTFKDAKDPSEESLTAALATQEGKWLLFSRHGVVHNVE